MKYLIVVGGLVVCVVGGVLLWVQVNDIHLSLYKDALKDTYLYDRTLGHTLASVDDLAITETDVKNELFRRPSGSLTFLSDVGARRRYIDDWVKKKILLRLAQREGLTQSPKYLEEMQRFKESWLVNAYTQHYINDVLKSDQTLQNNPARPARPVLAIEASHIVLRSMADAKKARALLKGGRPFPEVASAMSIDQTTKDKGGSLGSITPEVKKTPWDKTLQSLRDGQVSEIVKTPAGYEILRRESAHTTMVLDAATLKRYETQQAYLVSKTETEKSTMKINVDQSRFDALLQELSSTSAPAASQ